MSGQIRPISVKFSNSKIYFKTMSPLSNLVSGFLKMAYVLTFNSKKCQKIKSDVDSFTCLFLDIDSPKNKDFFLILYVCCLDIVLQHVVKFLYQFKALDFTGF